MLGFVQAQSQPTLCHRFPVQECETDVSGLGLLHFSGLFLLFHPQSELLPNHLETGEGNRLVWCLEEKVTGDARQSINLELIDVLEHLEPEVVVALVLLLGFRRLDLDRHTRNGRHPTICCILQNPIAVLHCSSSFWLVCGFDFLATQ